MGYRTKYKNNLNLIAKASAVLLFNFCANNPPQSQAAKRYSKGNIIKAIKAKG